ncbi:MAG: phosphatase PAP2 family protein [Bacteroidia bacterium]|jgi:membrane-associated phospholipid phosphatase|nr:phosphatase PAP2 family protein [Bacteroidia bacterium]
MVTFRSLLAGLRYFLIPWLVFLAAGLIFLLIAGKAGAHLFISGHWNEVADHIFQFLTWFGDGVAYVIFCLLLFGWHRGIGLITSVSCMVASLITQLLKQFVFEDVVRPITWFHQNGMHTLIREVPFVENAYFNSFPSGHTTAAFAFFCSLSILARRHPFLQTGFFLLAAGVGYSRMYLSQHFLADVLAGSFIGTGTALLVVYIARRYMNFVLPSRAEL